MPNVTGLLLKQSKLTNVMVKIQTGKRIRGKSLESGI